MTEFQDLIQAVLSAQTEEELAQAMNDTERFIRTDKRIIGAGIISNGEFVEIKTEGSRHDDGV